MAGKTSASSFSVGGKVADGRAVAEAKALATQHRQKRASAQRDAEALKKEGRRVGTAIRRKVREDERAGRGMINVRPARRSGQRKSRTICPRFASVLNLSAPRSSKIGSDGMSSFHFKWTSRGTKPRKGQKNSHRYRAGEAVRHICYMMREEAREVPGGGIVSNISIDPDDIASLFGAIEELEQIGGRDNANIYCSIVIALPKELDCWARERVLGAIGEELEAEELPYAFVLHKPDIRGSQDNWHAHGMLSLRPFCKRDDGSYDLAATPSSDLNDATFIYRLREVAARAMNVEMARLEAEQGKPLRRFTHLSKADRGLDEASESKKGPGRKDIERRQQDLDAMRTERGALSRFTDLVEGFARRLAALSARAVRDHAGILAGMRKHAEIVTAVRRTAAVAADPVAVEPVGTRTAPIGTSQSPRSAADNRPAPGQDQMRQPALATPKQPKPAQPPSPPPATPSLPDDNFLEMMRKLRDREKGR